MTIGQYMSIINIILYFCILLEYYKSLLALDTYMYKIMIYYFPKIYRSTFL